MSFGFFKSIERCSVNMSDHSDDGPSEGDDNQIVHMEEGDGNDEDDDVMDLGE